MFKGRRGLCSSSHEQKLYRSNSASHNLIHHRAQRKHCLLSTSIDRRKKCTSNPPTFLPPPPSPLLLNFLFFIFKQSPVQCTMSSSDTHANEHLQSSVPSPLHTTRITWRRDPTQGQQSSGAVCVEVDVLGSPSLTVPTVSEDVKQH